jgi:hypothetical protein
VRITVLRSILGLLMVVAIAWPVLIASSGDEASVRMKCKYVICMLYPKTQIIEGALDKEEFASRFMKDYILGGERASPPAGSMVDGMLVVTDGRIVVSLPIVSWDAANGKKVYLCQGTSDPGRAPEFSAVAETREALIKKIKGNRSATRQ